MPELFEIGIRDQAVLLGESDPRSDRVGVGELGDADEDALDCAARIAGVESNEHIGAFVDAA